MLANAGLLDRHYLHINSSSFARRNGRFLGPRQHVAIKSTCHGKNSGVLSCAVYLRNASSTSDHRLYFCCRTALVLWDKSLILWVECWMSIKGRCLLRKAVCRIYWNVRCYQQQSKRSVICWIEMGLVEGHLVLILGKRLFLYERCRHAVTLS